MELDKYNGCTISNFKVLNYFVTHFKLLLNSIIVCKLQQIIVYFKKIDKMKVVSGNDLNDLNTFFILFDYTHCTLYR